MRGEYVSRVHTEATYPTKSSPSIGKTKRHTAQMNQFPTRANKFTLQTNEPVSTRVGLSPQELVPQWTGSNSSRVQQFLHKLRGEYIDSQHKRTHRLTNKIESADCFLVPCFSCQVLGQPVALQGILSERSSWKIVPAAAKSLAPMFPDWGQLTMSSKTPGWLSQISYQVQACCACCTTGQWMRETRCWGKEHCCREKSILTPCWTCFFNLLYIAFIIIL